MATLFIKRLDRKIKHCQKLYHFASRGDKEFEILRLEFLNNNSIIRDSFEKFITCCYSLESYF